MALSSGHGVAVFALVPVTVLVVCVLYRPLVVGLCNDHVRRRDLRRCSLVAVILCAGFTLPVLDIAGILAGSLHGCMMNELAVSRFYRLENSLAGVQFVSFLEAEICGNVLEVSHGRGVHAAPCRAVKAVFNTLKPGLYRCRKFAAVVGEYYVKRSGIGRILVILGGQGDLNCECNALIIIRSKRDCERACLAYIVNSVRTKMESELSVRIAGTRNNSRAYRPVLFSSDYGYLPHILRKSCNAHRYILVS